MKRRKKILTMSAKHSIAGLIFVTPWIAGFLIFFLYPLYQSLVFSFNKVTITAKGRSLSPVGFDNYRYFFTKDPYFVERLVAFLKDIILEVPLILVFSLILALLLNQKVKLKN
jgi:ABC-type sugar transport system permease subunit